MKKCTITSAIVAALYMVYAGWDPDERLTNNISLSQVGYDRNIAFSNNEIGEWMHVVWYDYRNGNWETYYKMWSPWLSSWGKYQNLSSNSSQSVNPSIAATETKAHVVWLNPSDIYYKRANYTAGAWSWSATQQPTFDNFYGRDPAIGCSGTNLHVIWTDNKDLNDEIYYLRSTMDGNSWESRVRLTNNPASSINPGITASGSYVHVVWQDQSEEGDFQNIQYKRSTDNGCNWGVNFLY